MDVWSSNGVPVGIIWWNGPVRRLTVITKMTLVHRGGALVLAEEQEPLQSSAPSLFGVDEELRHPNDFVPFKPRCDVLVTGSAYASPASTVMPVYFRVGMLERRLYALAGQPVSTIPLSSRYLRREPTSDSHVAAVGPLSPRHPQRIRLLDPRVTAQGTTWDRITLPSHFDGRYFNAAPFDQQLDSIASGLALVVSWRGAKPKSMWTPPLRPRLFVFDSMAESGLREVVASCDTLSIDTDQERCVLTFRGIIDAAPNGSFPTELAVFFGSPHDAVTPGMAKRIRAQSAPRPAMEGRDVDWLVPERIAERKSTPGPTSSPAPLRPPTFQPGLSFQSLAKTLRSVEPVPEPETETIGNDVAVARGFAPVSTRLPAFVQTLRSAEPVAEPGTETICDDEGAQVFSAPSVPFVQALRSAEPVAEPGTETICDDEGAQVFSAPSVPFVQALRSAEPVAEPGTETICDDEGAQVFSAPSVPFVQAEPLKEMVAQSLAQSRAAIAEPSLSKVEVALMSLDTYAEIKIDVWSGMALREALAKHGIDLRSFCLYTLRQADALKEDMRTANMDRVRAIRAALRRARDRKDPGSIGDHMTLVE